MVLFDRRRAVGERMIWSPAEISMVPVAVTAPLMRALPKKKLPVDPKGSSPARNVMLPPEGGEKKPGVTSPVTVAVLRVMFAPASTAMPSTLNS